MIVHTPCPMSHDRAHPVSHVALSVAYYCRWCAYNMGGTGLLLALPYIPVSALPCTPLLSAPACTMLSNLPCTIVLPELPCTPQHSHEQLVVLLAAPGTDALLALSCCFALFPKFAMLSAARSALHLLRLLFRGRLPECSQECCSGVMVLLGCNGAARM